MTGLELMEALSAMSYSTLNREVTTELAGVWTSVEYIAEASDDDGDLWPVLHLEGRGDEEPAETDREDDEEGTYRGPIDDYASSSLAVRGALHEFHSEFLVLAGSVPKVDPSGELLRRGWIGKHLGSGGSYALTAAGEREYTRIRLMPYGSPTT